MLANIFALILCLWCASSMPSTTRTNLSPIGIRSGNKNKSKEKEKYVIGIDFGTESVRVGLFSCDNGQMVSSSSCPYRRGTVFPKSGWAEQYPDDWWEAVGTASKACLADSNVDKHHIVSIGMDTTACSVVVLDEHYNPLRPCLLWMDCRSAPQTQSILNKGAGDPALVSKLPHDMQSNSIPFGHIQSHAITQRHMRSHTLT